MSERAGHSGPGVTRRDAIRRGAVLGGTLVWAAPVMQTLSMSAAHAQAGSPRPPGDGPPSYVALNVVCGGVAHFVKFEVDEAETGGAFEDGPGKAPTERHCGFFTAVGEKDDGTGQGMTGSVEGDCITIQTGTCVVTASAVKKGQNCEPGPTGAGTLEFCS